MTINNSSIFNIDNEKDYLKFKNKVNINELDENGETALFLSDEMKCEWLIRHGINIHHKNPYNGCNAFYTSFELETPLRTKLLIDSGLKVNDLNKNNENPLFLLHKNDSKIIMIENGVNINQVNVFGRDALYNANEEFAEILIKKDIDLSRYSYEFEDLLDQIKYHKVIHLILKEKERKRQEMINLEKKNILHKIDIVEKVELVKKTKRI